MQNYSGVKHGCQLNVWEARTRADNLLEGVVSVFLWKPRHTLCLPLQYDNMLITREACYNTPLLLTTIHSETRGMMSSWHCQARWLCSPLHSVLFDYRRLDHCVFSVRQTFQWINLIGRYRNPSRCVQTVCPVLFCNIGVVRNEIVCFVR